MSSWNWQADKDDVSSAAACFGALKHPRKMLLSDPSGSDLTGVPFSICYPFDSSFYLRSVSKTQPMLCVKKQWDLYRMTWMVDEDQRRQAQRQWTQQRKTLQQRTHRRRIQRRLSNDDEGPSGWQMTIGMTDDCPYDNQKVPHSTVVQSTGLLWVWRA